MKQRRCLSVAALLVSGGGVIVLILACTALSGAATGSGERIAFIDEAGEVLTVSPNGTGSRRLTNDGVEKVSPAWSPDGERIAFIAQVGAFDDVFVVKRDGAGLGRVTTGAHAYSVTWSPDGTRLLLSLSSLTGRDGIAEVQLSDRPRARLRRLAGSRERMAAGYSPDGGSIAFQERGSIATARIEGGMLVALRRIAPGRDARWMGRGSALAVLQNDAIRSVPLGDGAPMIILRDAGNVTAFDLDRGGQRVVFDDSVERGNSDVTHVFASRVGVDVRRDVTGARLSGEAPAWQPRCSITGTPRADRIFGTVGDDVICALEGNDLILARGGHDIVLGGDGNDEIDGGTGRDFLFGGTGQDRISSRLGGRDVVDGGPGTDAAWFDHRGVDTIRGIEVTVDSGVKG